MRAQGHQSQVFQYVLTMCGLPAVQGSYDKLIAEVPKYKMITPSVLADRLRVSVLLLCKACEPVAGSGRAAISGCPQACIVDMRSPFQSLCNAPADQRQPGARRHQGSGREGHHPRGVQVGPPGDLDPRHKHRRRLSRQRGCSLRGQHEVSQAQVCVGRLLCDPGHGPAASEGLEQGVASPVGICSRQWMQVVQTVFAALRCSVLLACCSVLEPPVITDCHMKPISNTP